MRYIHSPSSLMEFDKCPRSFQAKYITNEIRWKPSAVKSRGTWIHEKIQRSIMAGVPLDIADDKICMDYTRSRVEYVKSLVSTGGTVYTEMKIGMGAGFCKAEYYDENTYMRARSDIVYYNKDTGYLYVADIKTGRNWDAKHIQLLSTALIGAAYFNPTKVDYEYWYVDSGETVGDSLMLPRDLFTYKIPPVVTMVLEIDRTIKCGIFSSRRNALCKYCELLQECVDTGE